MNTVGIIYNFPITDIDEAIALITVWLINYIFINNISTMKLAMDNLFLWH
jgi:hypothetical protein